MQAAFPEGSNSPSTICAFGLMVPLPKLHLGRNCAAWIVADLSAPLFASLNMPRMKRTPSSPQQFLKRHALRACNWLAQLLIVLPVFERIAPKRARIWLDQRLTILARFALDFIFFHAAHMRPAPPRLRNYHQAVLAGRRHDVRMRVRYSLRAVIGGYLRHALKARGFKARAEAILFALRNYLKLAARLARRAGLSRRASAHTCVRDALAAVIAPAACAAPALAADGGPRADTS